MKTFCQLGAVLLLGLLLSGCSQPPDETSSPMTWHGQETTAFAEPVTIEVYASSPEQATQALQIAVDDMHYVAGIAHPWRPGALGRTNELLALNVEFSANPSGLPLIRHATELYRQSEGYFNPAMGHLQRLWGFHQDDLDFVLPATEEEIATLLAAAPTMEDIHIDGIRVVARNPQLRLDYGPFAIGHGLDVVRQQLRNEGIAQARLHTRNAYLLLGEATEAVLPAHYPGLNLSLEANEAFYTVSIEDRYYELDGRSIHNHINPFHGQPVYGIRHLSVIHPDSAASAAAQAQALLLAGEETLPALAQRMDIHHYLFQHADGRLFASPALRSRLAEPQQTLPLPPSSP